MQSAIVPRFLFVKPWRRAGLNSELVWLSSFLDCYTGHPRRRRIPAELLRRNGIALGRPLPRYENTSGMLPESYRGIDRWSHACYTCTVYQRF
jgi:hypothetical protein